MKIELYEKTGEFYLLTSSSPERNQGRPVRLWCSYKMDIIGRGDCRECIRACMGTPTKPTFEGETIIGYEAFSNLLSIRSRTFDRDTLEFELQSFFETHTVNGKYNRASSW